MRHRLLGEPAFGPFRAYFRPPLEVVVLIDHDVTGCPVKSLVCIGSIFDQRRVLFEEVCGYDLIHYLYQVVRIRMLAAIRVVFGLKKLVHKGDETNLCSVFFDEEHKLDENIATTFK